MAGNRNVFKNKNIQDAVFVFLFGVALMAHSLKEHYGGNTQEWKLSAYLFPILVAIFLILLSIALLFDGLHQLKNAHEEAGEKVAWKPVLVVIALSIAYYFAIKPLHFIPATIIFLGLLIFFLGERRMWLIALISVISVFTLYGIFGIALKVMLP